MQNNACDLTYQMVYDKAEATFDRIGEKYVNTAKGFFPGVDRERLAELARGMFCAGYTISYAENVGTNVIPS